MAPKRDREKSSERVQRPDLPRSEPIRSWSGLFGSGARPGSTRSAVDSVQRGVELGYRVIDEYVKQGASMAGSFTGPTASRIPGAPDLSEMTERMVKYASDFTSLWFDTMGQVMTAASNGSAPNGSPSRSTPSPTPAAHEAKAPPVSRTGEPTPLRLTLHVRSRATVDVDLALDDGAQVGTALRVEPLRRRGSERAITTVSIAPPPAEGGPLRVSIDVPDDTPSGRYTAAVVDEASGQPHGRLTVVVSA